MSGTLQWRSVGKTYGSVVACRNVDLVLSAGEVHALVGENGAGKSTLLSLAGGEASPDTGAVSVDGDEASGPWTPTVAMANGIGLVHQHFMLIPPMSVVENVVLGREPRKGLGLDLEKAAGELTALAARVGWTVDPWAKVSSLSVGQQQRVEILKVLWRGARFLLLDEPTAVLTPSEVGPLFEVLRRLAAEGVAVAIVTHKVDEVVHVADRVTVMRHGEVVARLEAPLTAAEIARAIVGREPLPPPQVPRPQGQGGGLVVRGLRVGRALGPVDLAIAPGEVLGIAGVLGNGQTELVLALAGLAPDALGEVTLGERPLDPRGGAAAAARAGVSHIAEDRLERGVVREFSVADNYLLGHQRRLAPSGWLDFGALDAEVSAALEAYDVRPRDASAPIRSLSGGNQQKVVVARELSRPGLRLLIAAQPTRGVDVGAMERIHEAIAAAASRGAAVVLVTSDLHELRALSHRVAVMYAGRIVDTMDVSDASDLRLGAAMTGAR